MTTGVLELRLHTEDCYLNSTWYLGRTQTIKNQCIQLMSSEQTSSSSRHHQYQQTAHVLARDSVINVIITSVYIYIQGALGNLEACGMGVQRRIKQSYVPRWWLDIKLREGRSLYLSCVPFYFLSVAHRRNSIKISWMNDEWMNEYVLQIEEREAQEGKWFDLTSIPGASCRNAYPGLQIPNSVHITVDQLPKGLVKTVQESWAHCFTARLDKLITYLWHWTADCIISLFPTHMEQLSSCASVGNFLVCC